MEPFIWMFKEKDFKKYFSSLVIFSVVLFIVFIVFLALSQTFLGSDIMGGASYLSILFFILGTVFFLFSLLVPLGYYWELVEKIIGRKSDVETSNIYNGRVKTIYKIEFPEFKVFKLAWRGFASIIANIIMFVPYAILIFSSISTGNFEYIYPNLLIISYTFFCFMVPALLWNYANNNSVFSVLNFPKAIYIIGNYPLKYIMMLVYFIVIVAVNYVIDKFFIEILTPVIPQISIAQITLETLNINFLWILIYLIISVIKAFYFYFVSAYLLGALLPAEEI